MHCIKDNNLEIIKRTIIKVAKPDKIIIVGSRAEGRQHSGSDYDILFLKKNLRNTRQVARNIYINLDVNASVDVLITTPVRYNELKDKWFLIYNDIHKYGKVIY